VGGADAVLGCAKQIFAAGGRPLAVTDCLNFGSPDDPAVMREFSDSVDGISTACQELGISVVSGNVSLYNSTDGVSIYPTPMIGVVGRVEDIRLVTPACLQESHDIDLYLLAPAAPLEKTRSFAASLAAKVNKIPPTEGALHEISWKEELLAADCLEDLRSERLLKAVRDVQQGGAGIAILKMIGNKFFEKPGLNLLFKGAFDFFGEGGARYVVAIERQHVTRAESIVSKWHLELSIAARLRFDCSNQVTAYYGTSAATDLAAVFNSAQLMGDI
jgi:phosphoribosylformylglycinamidine synthase